MMVGGNLLTKALPKGAKELFNPFIGGEGSQFGSSDLFEVGHVAYMPLMNLVQNDNYQCSGKKNCAYSVDFNTVDTAIEQSMVRLNFDSAINSFPEEHYQQVCEIDHVDFRIALNASRWTVLIMRRIGNNEPQLVSSKTGSGAAVIDMPVSLYGRAHRLYVEIVATLDIEISQAVWACVAPVKRAQLGISITTYNKQEFLIHNINNIMNSSVGKSGLVDLLIINNGDDIGISPDNFDIINLPNVGGTGGFLAGRKHFKDKGYDKFVIMDDDIVIGDDFINRLYAISCFSRGKHIGTMAEMLNTDERIIKEQGGHVAQYHVFGLDLRNHLLDIAGWDMHSLFGYVPMTFSGWWSLIVDLDVEPKIEPNLFIKRDDIAFGLDSWMLGIQTIVFPNLMIAHSEEGAPAYYYYDVRNDLIMRAKQGHTFEIKPQQLHKLAIKNFLRFKIDRQRMFNMALRDFIAGPDQLSNKPVAETLIKVR